MFIPLSAKQAVNHGFYFVKGKIVYIWCSDMVGKITLTKMELIIYGIDKEVKFDKERKNSKV